jgi:DNA polymerase
MTDERTEAASIVKAVRRYIERERAAGSGDLLADSATRARSTGADHARELGGSTDRAREPGGSVRGVAGPTDRAQAGAGGRGTLPGPPLPIEHHMATNLFGEAELEPAAPSQRAAQATSLLESPSLPVFADDLSPGGLEARAAIAQSALPVLAQVAEEARACTKCGLCRTRTQAVPGVGTARGGIVFVGEAPGADEDRQGEPFVGRAGQLLDKIIKAMDDARLIPGLPLDRQSVYICNVLKCRPPENRNPLPHEIESCSPYLRRQLDAIKPRIICCLGKFAAELLVGVKGTIRDLRGKVYRYQGAKLIVTYHPAACLRSASYKRPVWEDMQLLAREYLSD